ncbi:MAG TPA: hypothetical protein PKO23_14650, partial [Candidatus Hydrogenedentes bacterium]|nr:hypothetical protein [Candidatus Hydrogenedentota bacterium]
LKSRWDIEFKHSLFTATIYCQKMWVITRGAFGNARGRAILFRGPHVMNVEFKASVQGREVQVRLHLRYEIQFRNEPGSKVP